MATAKRKTRAKTAKSAKRAPRKKSTKAKKARKVARASKAKAVKVKHRPAEPRSARAKAKPARRAAVAPRTKRSITALPAGVAREAVVGRLEALQSKLNAIERLEAALRARRTNTPADDIEINPNLDALRTEKRTVEAQIAAAMTQTLAPPGAADILALREAIRNAEDVIARNEAVNRLIKAATALIKALQD